MKHNDSLGVIQDLIHLFNPRFGSIRKTHNQRRMENITYQLPNFGLGGPRVPNYKATYRALWQPMLCSQVVWRHTLSLKPKKIIIHHNRCLMTGDGDTTNRW